MAAALVLAAVCTGRAGEVERPAERPADPPVHVGSELCAACHPDEADAWRESPHARTLRDVSRADRIRLAENLLCAGRPVDRVVGLRRELRFLGRDEEGVTRVLPCRWNRREQVWEAVGSDPGPVWDEVCANCHVTGSGPAREDGIGCEACHGPGSAHAASPAEVLPFVFRADEPRRGASVCGSCHLQGGTAPDGSPFAKGFHPGADLMARFRYDWEGLDAEEGDVHSQLSLREVLRDGHSPQGAIPCQDCHGSHDLRAPHHAERPRVDLCNQCHLPGSPELKPNRETRCPVCDL